MKAIVCNRYGNPEVLQLMELDKPVAKENEILIRVIATAVNSADWRLRKPDPFAARLFFGLTKPKRNILGGVLAGEVEATGKNVTRFKAGDKVFGSTGMKFGAYAEYNCLPQDAVITIKPENISYSEAATIPFGGTTALHFLKKAGITKGQSILIYGASGAVGTAAVQIAKYLGGEVTGVCSATNVDMVRSLGAVDVIDYTSEDFSDNGKTYDVIFDTVGKIKYGSAIKSLNKNGMLIMGSAGVKDFVKGLITNFTSSKKVLSGMISEEIVDLSFLKKMMEEGKLKPVIDKTFPLEEMVKAHYYVEKGHKKGNVAIIISSETY